MLRLRTLSGILLFVLCLPLFAAWPQNCPPQFSITSIAANDVQINQPVTITWSTTGANVIAQTIDISDVAYGIQLLASQRSYTYTPVKPGEVHARINASSGCDYVAAETKFHVQNCPVDSTRTMTLSATQVLPGTTVTAQVALGDHETVRWVVSGGTLVSSSNGSATINAGAPGTLTIDAYISRNNNCAARVTGTVQIVCPDLTRDMILQSETAQAAGSFYAIVPQASNESVRWEVTGGAITATWLTPVGDGVGAAVGIAVGGPGTLTIDAFVSRDGACETKIERTVQILCVDVPWRGGVIVGEDPVRSGAALVAGINGDPAIDTFRWEVTNGTITSTDGTFAYITAGGPGTMTITAIVSRNGCEFRYSRNVAVVCGGEDVTLGLFWSGGNTHSPNSTFTAFSNAPAGYTTHWEITNGSVSTTTGTSTVVTLGSSGTTILHMTITNPYGCVVADRSAYFFIF